MPTFLLCGKTGHEASDVDVEFSFEEENLDRVLMKLEDFLLALGYRFDGNLTFVEDAPVELWPASATSAAVDP